MSPKFHSLHISEIKQETDDTVSIAFEIPKEYANDYKFLSGQYLTLRADIQGEDVRRSYSLCSAPFENEWRVAVKQVENGKFSTYANKELKKGSVLDVMTPMGNFAISTNIEHENSYVFFAAGSGITPILSMIKSILHEEPKSDVTLFYGNKNFGSIIFREEIEALKNEYMDALRVVHILSRESLGNKIQKGRIDSEKCENLYNAFLKDTLISGVYVCGPEEMIFAVKDKMTEKGVDSSKIHFELFTASSSAPKPVSESLSDENAVKSNVKIIIDGDEIDLLLNSDGESVLDAAHRVGADLPFACKGGVCCTCKAKIIEGKAKMTVNYSLEPDEVEAGYVLTCQTHPTTENLVISFDD